MYCKIGQIEFVGIEGILMLAVLLITAAVVAALIFLVIRLPAIRIKGHTVNIYWTAPFIGAVLLLTVGALPLPRAVEGLTQASDINPLKILLLFLSMTMLSVFLDEAGFFRVLAGIVLQRAKGSQTALFLSLYVTVSVLTVFTSNDIIVLTFTPFICYFAHNAHIDPLPYLFGEFVAANTWSMALMIGNPTNIYLATGAALSFGSYFRIMALPTLLAGTVSLLLLLLLFRRSLSAPLHANPERIAVRDRGPIIIGVLHLAGCILCLSFASYWNLPMWLISCGFSLCLFVVALFYCLFHRQKPFILLHSLRRLPWDIIPFVLSMFLIVLALNEHGVTALAADLLSSWNPVWGYGISSFLCANIVNNIPMSVLFGAVLNAAASPVSLASLYAVVIGSNLGALLTPIGALAGIMWIGMLRNRGVELSFARFTLFGCAVSIPSLAAALLGLCLVI